LTIDYGPYGWLENFDPDWTPNTTDAHGKRYRYGHQPQIAMWNLVQLANAIYPLIEDAEPLEQALGVYASTYEKNWQNMMAGKLGLEKYVPDTDLALVTELLEILQLVETDMTIFYRRLAHISTPEKISSQQCQELFADAYYVPEQIDANYLERMTAWANSYIQRLDSNSIDDAERGARMNSVNPKYVLRNYLAQLAIDKAEGGDYTLTNELLEVLRTPYDEQPEMERHAAKRPDWARDRAGCSMLSCSS
jgi:uncharacterized protein YdiU (UPF0061 family)